MKNVTVSLDDETYRRAKRYAVDRDMSLSALVRAYLNDIGSGESMAERLRREEHMLRERIDARLGAPRPVRSERPMREQVHDRARARAEARDVP